MRTSELISKLKEAECNNKEAHIVAYKDKTWEITVERHPYGMIRMWVSYEYSSGAYNASLVTYVKDPNTKAVKLFTNFVLKKAVKDRAIEIWRAIDKAGLIR